MVMKHQNSVILHHQIPTKKRQAVDPHEMNHFLHGSTLLTIHPGPPCSHSVTGPIFGAGSIHVDLLSKCPSHFRKPWWTSYELRALPKSLCVSLTLYNFDDISFLFHSSLHSWRHTAAPCELYWTGFISDTWACSAHGLRKSTFSLQA